MMRTYYQKSGDNFPNDYGFYSGEIFYHQCVFFIENDILYYLDSEGNIDLLHDVELDEFKQDLEFGYLIEARFLH